MVRFLSFVCNFCLASNKQSKASSFSDTLLVVSQSTPEFVQGSPLAAAQPIGGRTAFLHPFTSSADAIKTFHWLTTKRQRCLNCWVIQEASFSFFFFNFYLFIYLFIHSFMAVLGLRFCARAFSSCGKWGPLFITVRGPLTVAASLVAEHRLQTRRLSSCGARA